MTSLRHRELGATLRQCCLTGQPATVVIDHKTYLVHTEMIADRDRYNMWADLSRVRYGVWPEGSAYYPLYPDWDAAKVHLEAIGSDVFRIYDFSVVPPRDVTGEQP